MRLKVIFIAFIVTSFSSFILSDLIYGKWKVEKVIIGSHPPIRNVEKWIEFKEDGTVESGRMGNPADMTGQWKYNQKENSITMEKTLKDDGEYFIKEINRKNLTMVKDSVTIYLEKESK